MKKTQKNQEIKFDEPQQWSMNFDSLQKSISSKQNETKYEINSDMIQDDEINQAQFLKRKKQRQLNEGERDLQLVNRRIVSRQAQLSVQKAQKVHPKLVSMVFVSYFMQKKIEKKVNQFTAQPMKGNINKKKNYLNHFFNTLQDSLQTIKWLRVENIPKEKRIYYLGTEDVLSIHLKKYLQSLIMQMVKIFELKKSITLPDHHQTYQDIVIASQDLVMTRAQIINSELFRKKIQKINQRENKQFKKNMIENSLSKNFQFNQTIMNSIGRKIKQIHSEEQNITKMNNSQQIQAGEITIQSYEHMLSVLSPKSLFILANSLKRQKSVQEMLSDTFKV